MIQHIINTMLLDAGLARIRRGRGRHRNVDPEQLVPLLEENLPISSKPPTNIVLPPAHLDDVPDIVPSSLPHENFVPKNDAPLPKPKDRKAARRAAKLSSLPTTAEVRAARRLRASLPPTPEQLTVRVPRLSRLSSVAPATSLADIFTHVPVRVRGRDMQCVFSTMRDGVCLSTLYANIARKEHIVILVRDSEGASFGVYSAAPLVIDGAYHGSGETFVFSVKPTIQVFPWTRRNSFFQLGTQSMLAFGGGSDGGFALSLDEMLERGSSAPSETYGNKCLASSEQFKAVVVEAFELVVPSRLSIEENK